ncbi:conserved hypothetical protein [Ricinus communis]|uniref:Uncharacterized protein n=1 Tax=Ricinus communis TaxID=3988 RepID=B9TPK5_RICCO|nr:conserved hypothetical protein [Ricinus communis]
MKAHRLQRDDGIPALPFDLRPDARADHQVDARQIEDREVAAVRHMAQHVEIVRPHAKRRDAGIEHMQMPAARTQQESEEQA